MSDRFFIDTNVFIYSFDQRAPSKAARARQLIGESVTSQKGAVSYQIVQEFFNVAIKRFTPPMTTSEAERYFYQTFLPILNIHSSATLLTQALHLRAQYRLSWYDSLVVCAALQAGCGTLFTEDLQHGQRFGSLRVVNPFLS